MFKSIGEKLSRKTGGAPPQTVELIRQTLTQVIDPDLHRDIVSLGFVKEIDVKGNGAKIVVELTTPACPAKDQMQKQIEELTLAIDGISEVDVVFTADTRARKTTLGADVLPALGRVKNIVAVASGKGGVGKSTTTVNLAYALAKAGSKVGILDADIYGPSIPLMTGVADPTETEGTMVVPPMVDGVKAISVAMFAQKGGAQLMRGPMTAQIIKQFLTQIAWGELDYLLIDYPPGTGDIQLTLSQMAPISGAVLVTTPQEVALVDVRKAIKMFSTTKVPILGVVETMSYFVCDGCDKRHEIFRSEGGQRVADENGIPLLGQIPMEPGVALGSDSGKPVVQGVPESLAAVGFTEASGKVASQLAILASSELDSLTSFDLQWH